MLKAIIYDLDGVLCSTDEYHYRAWARLAAELGVPYDRAVNRRQLGVGRMDALDILLEKSPAAYSAEQKIELASRKNGYYLEQLDELSPADAFSGAAETLKALRERGVKTALGSSSKNAKFVLDRIGLMPLFDAIADGTDDVRSKPAPDIFLYAAHKLGVEPAECAAVDDAPAGVEAALCAGMYAVAYGSAAGERADAAITEHSEILALLDRPAKGAAK